MEIGRKGARGQSRKRTPLIVDAHKKGMDERERRELERVNVMPNNMYPEVQFELGSV